MHAHIKVVKKILYTYMLEKNKNKKIFVWMIGLKSYKNRELNQYNQQTLAGLG